MPSDRPLWDEREAHLVRHLLGDLPEGDREAIENRLFEDRGFVDEVQAVTDDLIDAYLAGILSPEDTARFESHFLASPVRRARFEFIRDLASAAREPDASERSTRPWMWAAVAAVLVAVAWMFLRPAPEPRHIAGTPTPAPVRSTPVRPVETQVVQLAAAPDAPVDVALPAGTRTVRLEVPIEGDYHLSFDAVIRDTAGAVAWEATGLVPPGAGMALVLNVPASVLAADAYALDVRSETLRGGTQKPLSRKYTLRVTRAR